MSSPSNSLVHHTDAATYLYHTREDQTKPRYNIYALQEGQRSTQHGAQYDWMGIGDGVNPGTYYASISMNSATRVVLHSMSPQPCIYITPTTFCEILESYGDSRLWENLSYDGNGEWIQEGLVAGSICITHDGSYMPKESTTLSSAGIIIYCKNTKQWLKILVMEHSNAASNYRGELLGAVLALLILRATTSMMTTLYPRTMLHCNNKGVIGHSNSPLRSLPERNNNKQT